MERLYNQGQATTVFNVGTLVHPTTRETLGSSMLPRNLYSHADQIQQWQGSDPDGGGTGWGGRVNDVVASLNTGPLAPDTGLRLVSAANGVLEGSIQSAQEINAALEGAPPLPVTFPNSSLGRQLGQVAQVMAVRGALGMNRQLFFAGMGGFDNHEDLVAKHQQLMATLDAAVGAFIATLDTWGLLNMATVFTESEFNRTGNANANIGADHAWGSHHLVLGGAVLGGQTYGTFPTHQLGGPDDARSRGNWIPTTSLDQYAATLGGWFGVPDAQLDLIFPNLPNFVPRRLGFL